MSEAILKQAPNPGPYPDPLTPYLSLPPLSTKTTTSPQNKAYYPASASSSTPTHFPLPVANNPSHPESAVSGFDAHIYSPLPSPTLSLEQAEQYFTRLHTALRHAFPHIRVYKLNSKPAGPHPMPSFEAALFTPDEFAAVVPWLALWRGPCSVLVHPNTEAPKGRDGEGEGERAVNDHTSRAMWLGTPVELNLNFLRQHSGGRGMTRAGTQGAVGAGEKVSISTSISSTTDARTSNDRKRSAKESSPAPLTLRPRESQEPLTRGADMGGIPSPQFSRAWAEWRAVFER